MQKRREKDYRLIAEIVSRFDLVALQEVNDDLSGLRALQARLDPNYGVLFNDAGGNDERFAFLYDARKVTPQEEIGELTVPYTDLARVRLPTIRARFAGFDRNPMIASFKVRDTVLLLVNIHLYFGSGRGPGLVDDEAPTSTPAGATGTSAAPAAELPAARGIDRRVLEAYTVAWWANQRRQDTKAYTQNVIALGDFNLPKQRPGDRVYDALTRLGLHLPEHSTYVGGSNIRDDAHYDQMALWPGPIEQAMQAAGTLDFDTAILRGLWSAGTAPERTRFYAYVQYYLSDHRPLWLALGV